MTLRISIGLLIVATALCAGDARADRVAVKLYTLVARQIDQGTIDATLALGSDEFPLPGTWIEPGRNATAVLHVVARNGQVDHGTVRFEPPLVAVMKRRRFQIEAITVGRGGRASSLALANPSQAGDVPAELRAALDIQRALSRLLSGALFRLERNPACSAVGTPCRTQARVVRRIAWTASATLLESTWRFLDESPSECLTLSTTQTVVHVKRAEYQTASAETSIELESNGFNLNGRSCAFVGAPLLKLDIAGGSFIVARIAAQYQPPIAAQPAVDQAEIRLADGAFRLGGGSELDLAQDSELVEHIGITAGSLRFASLAIALRAGRAISLDITSNGRADANPDTALDAQLGSGTLRMWRKSRAAVKSGVVRLPITIAHWETGRRPVVVSDERAASIDVELDRGVFQWNDDTRIPSQGGHVQGAQLSFDGRHGTGFVGTLAQVEIQSGDGGRLHVPGSFVLDGMKPTEIHASDPSRPVVIAALDRYPQGRILLSGVAASLTSTMDKAISCDSSHYELDIVFTEGGYQILHPLHCRGDYTIDTSGFRLRGTADLQIDALQLGPNGLRGSGKLSVSVPAGTTLDVAIAQGAPNVDKVGFIVKQVRSRTTALNLSVALRDPVTFSGEVTISDHQISFGPSSARARFAIRAPADVEVATAVVEFDELLFLTPPPCDYHVFLEAGEYETAASFRLQLAGSVATLDVDHLDEFRPKPRHHEAGCDLAMFVLDVIVAHLIPIGIPGAELVRRAAIDQILEEIVAKATQEFSKQLARRDLTPILGQPGGP